MSNELELFINNATGGGLLLKQSLWPGALANSRSLYYVHSNAKSTFKPRKSRLYKDVHVL